MRGVFKRLISLLGLFLAFLILLLLIAFFVIFFDISFPSFDTIKDFGEGIKPFIEVVAIIVAGLWSYRLFIKNRTEYPYAELAHNISHVNLDNKHIYLCVLVTLKNAGNVLLELDISKMFVQQIIPLLDELTIMIDNSNIQDIREGKVDDLFDDNGMQIAWRGVGFREIEWDKDEVFIEPGEQEEFQFDFILENEIQIIKITSYFRNVKTKKPKIGWKHTSIYDLDKGVLNVRAGKQEIT